MKACLGLTLLLAAALSLGLLVQRDPGYILINYRHLSIETSLWFAVGAMITAFAVLLGLIHLIKQPRLLSQQWSAWRAKRQARKHGRHMHRALSACLTHDWKTAQRALAKLARSRYPHSLLYRICLAYLSHHTENSSQCNQQLDFIAVKEPGLADTLRMLYALSTHEISSAKALLDRHTPASLARHPALLFLSTHCYSPQTDAARLLALLPALSQHLPTDAAHTLAHQTYDACLKQAPDHATLDQYWQQIQKRKQAGEALTYYACSARLGGTESTRKRLEKSLNKKRDRDLALCYATYPGADPKRSADYLTDSLSDAPKDAALLTALAKQALAAGELGQASAYLKTTGATSREQLNLLGDIALAQQAFEQAAAYYQQALKTT
jgi:HemY protein